MSSKSVTFEFLSGEFLTGYRRASTPVFVVLTLAFLIALPVFATAKSIYGIIEFGAASVSAGSTIGLNKIPEVRVRPTDRGRLSSQTFPVQTTLPIRLSLLNLSAGDYVVLSGEYTDSNFDGRVDTLDVNAIESVGLRKLLGSWRNPMWDVFHFQDFNRLELYQPTTIPQRRLSSEFRKTKVLSYTLAPESSGGYSVLMVEAAEGGPIGDVSPRTVFAGRIELNGSEAKLDVFDPVSGATVESHSLTPLDLDK